MNVNKARKAKFRRLAHRPRIVKKEIMATPQLDRGTDAALGRAVQDRFIPSLTETYSAEPINIPDLFTQLPVVRDSLETSTSLIQDETAELCLPFLSGEDEYTDYNDHGVPRLDKQKHTRFLHNSLKQLAGRFIGYDASRPWFLYWCLSGLKVLGEDVLSYRDRVVETAQSMQNGTGGFGGGGGQTSHLATTYAVVLALALAGGKEAYNCVNRRALWKWFSSLKQADGGFQVCLGGEQDVRGAYCAAVVISLLQLPLDLTADSPARGAGLDNLFSGLADYVRRCQTFEGGISAQPGTEAHGGYAFCALGCLSLLDLPSRIIPKYLDLPRLISWLSARQYAPEGGFSGRTNKLVDGCYSHWVGGCWPLIEACLKADSPQKVVGTWTASRNAIPSSMFCREGLIRYILCCCQDQTKRGGLRDKPGKMSDPYHTCYVLSGLSSAQHRWELALASPAESGQGVGSEWVVSPYSDDLQIFDQHDLVGTLHPVFAIPKEDAEAMSQFYTAMGRF